MATKIATYTNANAETAPFTVTGDFIIKLLNGSATLNGRLAADTSGANAVYLPVSESSSSNLLPNILPIGITKVTPFETGMGFTLSPKISPFTAEIWTL